MVINFEANKISKKFNKDWIFKNVSFSVSENDVLGITGNNGSGKSTLLQILSGYRIPSNGTVKLTNEGVEVSQDEFYKHISLSSPFLELMEEFTLVEQLDFYFMFRKLKNNLSVADLPALVLLEEHKNKYLRDFSSGMKQRVKLLMAITTDSQLLFLDEPCSNLDAAGIEWYKKMIAQFSSKRIVIISSNSQIDELFNCNKFIAMEDFIQSS